MPFKRPLSNKKAAKLQPPAKFQRLAAAPSKNNKTDRIPTDGLSNSQLTKLIEWGLQVNYEQTKWWDLQESLATEVRSLDEHLAQSLSPESYTTPEHACTQLIDRARRILQRIYLVNPSMLTGDLAWTRKIAHAGTLADKHAAKIELLKACPFVHVAELRKLLASVKAKNRTEAMGALNAVRDVWVSTFLLPDSRALKFINDEDSLARELFVVKTDSGFKLNLTDLDTCSLRLKLLAWCIFEHDMKIAFINLLESMNLWSGDGIAHVRKTVIDCAFEMLACKSEQEDKLLTLLVRSLADLEKYMARHGMQQLAHLLTLHPSMKPIVCKKVEELIWMQKVTVSAMKARLNKKLTAAEKRIKRADKRKLLKAQFHGEKNRAQLEAQNQLAETEAEKKMSTSSKRAFQAVYHAVLFLAEIQYSTKFDKPGFVPQMLQRYVRCLLVMLRPLDALAGMERKAFRQKLKSIERTGKASGEPMVTFVHGLAYTSTGAQVIRRILAGVRRLLPYIKEDKLVTAFGKHEAPKETKTEKSHTMIKRAKKSSKKEEVKSDEIKSDAKSEGDVKVKVEIGDGTIETGLTGHASIDIANQLLLLAHRAPEWTTRIHTWDLLYRVLRKTNRLTTTFFANFYNHIRHYELFESSQSPMLLRLIAEMVRDPMTPSVTVRIALLRRLVTMISFYGNPPSRILRILESVVEMQSEHPEVYAWITTNKSDAELGNNYSPQTFNPQSSGAETTQPWELSLLQTSIFKSIRDAAATAKTAKKDLIRDEEEIEDESVYMQKHWPALVPLAEDDTDDTRTMKLRLAQNAVEKSISLSVLVRLMSNRTLRASLGLPTTGTQVVEDEDLKLPKKSGEDPLAMNAQAPVDSDDDGGEVLSKVATDSVVDDLWSLEPGTRALWKSDLDFPFRDLLEPHFTTALSRNKYQKNGTLADDAAFDQAEKAYFAQFGSSVGMEEQEGGLDSDDEEEVYSSSSSGDEGFESAGESFSDDDDDEDDDI